MRKSHFEKWSYDHNGKGRSQRESQPQSSQQSAGTPSCLRSTATVPALILTWKANLQLLRVNLEFLSLFTETATQGRTSWKGNSCKSDLSFSGTPDSHTHESAAMCLTVGCFTCLEQCLAFLPVKFLFPLGHIFSLVKSKPDPDKEQSHECRRHQQGFTSVQWRVQSQRPARHGPSCCNIPCTGCIPHCKLCKPIDIFNFGVGLDK